MRRTRWRILSEKRRTAWLAVCAGCLLGVLLGALAGRRIDASEREALCAYLTAYAASAGEKTVDAGVVLEAAVAYLRYPALLFVFGMTSLGVFAAPLLCGVQCFSVAFAVSGFVSAIGRLGALLAFSAFGLRCVVTIPCICLMALWAMEYSAALRKGRQDGGRKYAMRFAVLLPMLLLGIGLELKLVPLLFALCAGRLL